MIDLGKWAKEEYRVAGEEVDPMDLLQPNDKEEDV